ncbi:PadR family transcriptional regulator [Glaciihabitans tibetensis]|nr:PadR family transcriptional regulator [Glaciihabitans tibetensis]
MATQDMREPTFLILAALANGKKHGYALIGEADELSGGRVKLKVGTLYAALDRLQAEGAVASAGEEVVDGRHRRYYELTDHGVAVLGDEVARMEQNLEQAKARLRMRPVPPVAVRLS